MADTEIFGKRYFGQDNPEIPLDMFRYINQFLPIQDQIRNARVNRVWRDASRRAPMFWNDRGIGGAANFNDFMNRFRALHQEIKKLVKWGGCDLATAEQITGILNRVDQPWINLLPQAIRDVLLDPTFPHQQHHFLTPMGIGLLMSGLVDLGEARTLPLNLMQLFIGSGWHYENIDGAYALSKKLITLRQASTLPQQNLTTLITKHGVKALEEGWISVDDARVSSVDVLNLFLRDYDYLTFISNPNRSLAMKALADKVLTIEDANQMSIDVLKNVLTPNGLRALNENLITLDQLKWMPEGACAQILFTDFGLVALSEGLITPEMLLDTKNGYYLSALVGQWGVEALREELVTPFEILSMLDGRNACLLLNEYGVSALRKKLITVEEANTLDHLIFMELMTFNGVAALEKGLITLDQARNYDALYYLVREGFSALEKGIITAEEVIKYGVDNIRPKAQKVLDAVQQINNYKTILSSLPDAKKSKNDNELGREKAKLLENYFPDNDAIATEKEVKNLLADKENVLLKNRSKLGKFFLVKSFFHGYRNPLLNNRLCESETEVRLVQLYKARQAG